MRVGKKTEAARHFARAAELVPDFVEAHDNLGSVLLETGDLRGVAHQFVITLRLNPNSAVARCNLGTVYLLQG